MIRALPTLNPDKPGRFAVRLVCMLALLAAAAAAQDAEEPNEAASESADSRPATRPGQRAKSLRLFHDRDSGVRLRYPKNWKPADRARFNDESGDVRGVWAGDGGAFIVLVVEPGGESITPRFLLDLAVKSLERQPGSSVKDQRLVTLKNKKAARLSWVGPGKPAPFSMSRERVFMDQLSMPVGSRTVVLKLVAPEAEPERHRAEFERVLESLSVNGAQSKAQREAE